MKTIHELRVDLSLQLSKLLGVNIGSLQVEKSNPKAGSHLALPCFRFSKELKLSPPEIAKKIVDEFSCTYIANISSDGPYVNFWVDDETLVSIISNNVENNLTNAKPNGKTAIVEFLSPNLAKPLSIGHLRNALQGNAISLSYKNQGYNTITDSHIGDWGTVFGMWVVGFEKFSSEQQLQEGGVKELGRVYVEVRKALKQEKEESKTRLSEDIQTWLKKLESGDKKAKEYHKKFTDISLSNVDQKMHELGISIDYSLGESFYIRRGKELVQELLNNDQAIKNNDGSVVIPLEDKGFDTPFLVEKANGAALYATSDIATIEYRESEWNPDEVVYVVGAEQKYYFAQLFAVNETLKLSDAKLIHHWYGLVEEVAPDGSRRKMSSRENAVFLSDAIDMAVKKAAEIAPEGLDEDDIKDIAVGAITFREFTASHTGNTLFDWQSMFKLSGFSGPYVQYAATRMQSILSKSGNTTTKAPESYDWGDVSNILWLLSNYTDTINGAHDSLEFHKVAEYTYELAKEWNRFYEKVNILESTGSDLNARLWLVEVLYLHLKRSLYLLGIKLPKKM